MNNANFSLDEVRTFCNLLGENIARLPVQQSNGSPKFLRRLLGRLPFLRSQEAPSAPTVDAQSVADLVRSFTVYMDVVHTMKGVEDALREMGFSAGHEESSNLHTSDVSQMACVNVYCETDEELAPTRDAIERTLDRDQFHVEITQPNRWTNSWIVVTLKPR